MNPQNQMENPFSRTRLVNKLDRDENSSYQQLYRHFIWGETPAVEDVSENSSQGNNQSNQSIMDGDPVEDPQPTDNANQAENEAEQSKD